MQKNVSSVHLGPMMDTTYKHPLLRPWKNVACLTESNAYLRQIRY
ncbi:hypothetical protein [Hafnia alvei]|nr:hypothetical protein [Hafnia alvei]